MNLKSLRAFLSVVDEGSLVAAARKMNLSQPAVSRLVQILEAELGVVLFHRGQKSLVPTQEAEVFYPEALRVLAAVDGFPDLFSRLHEDSAEPFHVICQMRAATGLVVPALARFIRRHPRIRTTLDIHPRRELGRRVQYNRFDVGIYVVPLQIKGLKLVSLRETQLSVLLPRDHPLASRSVLSPDDVADERYIALCRGLMVREVVDRTLARLDRRLEVFHEVNSAAVAHQLVSDGVGFCFSDLVSLDPHTQQCTTLVPWEPKLTVELGIFAPDGHPPHQALPDFIACLDEVWHEQTSGRIS